MSKFRVHALLLFVNLIYGANYTIAKEVMPAYILPFGFIVVRAVCACLLFILIHAIFIREKVKREDIPRLFLCGVFGVALNQLLFFKGLNLTTPINASLMMIITPVLVMIISSMMSVETISWTKIIGLIIGALGAFIVIFQGKEISFSEDSVLGDFYVLVNASSYAIFLVIVKPLTVKYHPLTVIKWVFIFGLAMVIPAGWSEVTLVEWEQFPLSIWLGVIYVVLGATFLAYLLNILALKNADPSAVGIYIYLQPVIATMIALLLMKDELTWVKAVAALLIFFGVYLVSRKPSRSTG